jgi:hypothetical protein
MCHEISQIAPRTMDVVAHTMTGRIQRSRSRPAGGTVAVSEAVEPALGARVDEGVTNEDSGFRIRDSG